MATAEEMNGEPIMPMTAMDAPYICIAALSSESDGHGGSHGEYDLETLRKAIVVSLVVFLRMIRSIVLKKRTSVRRCCQCVYAVSDGYFILMHDRAFRLNAMLERPALFRVARRYAIAVRL